MIAYLIKIVLCSGILLLAYFLLLEKEKMHSFNRFFLLFSLVFIWLVPFIRIEGQNEIIPFNESIYMISDTGNVPVISHSASKPVVNGEEKSWQPSPLLIIYSLVTALLLFRFFRNLFQLYKMTRRGERLQHQNAILVLCTDTIAPHSFLNYIFLSKNDYLGGKIEKEILYHEHAHVKQKHSLDIIFVELLLCFLWFNPFLYGYRRAIQLNHEFLADSAVVKKFRDTVSYQFLLLSKIDIRSHSLLSSSFNYFITKKRLVMMAKKISPLKAVLKQIFVLPLVIVLIILFSAKLVAQNPSPKIPETKQREKKDTIKRQSWIGLSIGYTKEGVSEELLKEYESIINKYKVGDSISVHIFQNITTEDKARMETIFKQMSLEQQRQQSVGFFKTPSPLSKVVPTKDQYNKYKNPKVYGVWIDGKKVSNETLNNYKNTDFSQVFISKLYGAAKKGRSYTHQVNMMTNSYYQDYYKKTKAESNKSMMFVMGRTMKENPQ